MTTNVAQTDVIAENNQSPDTDSVNQSEQKTPQVEVRDGKYFVDGVRVYHRDETNKIAANAKDQAIQGVLRDLDVDSLESVRDVIQTLKNSTPDNSDKLDVASLKQAVAKREATVEELSTQVKNLKTELTLRDHVGKLTNAMPGNWNADQKTAVLDLMRARDMLVLDGDQFGIRSGSEYLTTDGETPDYAGAVEIVAKTLGLNTGKRGVDLYASDRSGDAGSASQKGIDEARLKTDAEYRAAYAVIRQYNPTLWHTDVTHDKILKQIEQSRTARGITTPNRR